MPIPAVLQKICQACCSGDTLAQEGHTSCPCCIRYIKDDSSTKRSRYDGQYSAYGGYGGGYGYGAPPQPHGGYQAVSNTKDNPPCNTLFIGNLGDGVRLFYAGAIVSFCILSNELLHATPWSSAT